MIGNQTEKTIAIIGGGPAGITSCKSALECQFKPTVFEKSSDIGGVWSPSTTKAWDSMKTNVSKYSCSFSDFPHDKQDDLLLSQKQVYTYLLGYVDKFNLLEYFKFNCSVTKVSRVQDGSGSDTKWRVEWVEMNGALQVNKESIYDYVIVASGVNSKPAKYQQYELLSSSFNGRIIHSSEYKSPESYIDKRVLLIGNAFSGSQIACEVSSVAKSLHQLSRRENQWLLSSEPILQVAQSVQIKAPVDFFFFNRKQTYDNINSPEPIYNSMLNTQANGLTMSNYGSSQFKYDENAFYRPPYIVITNQEYVPLVEKGDIKLLKNYSINNVNGNQITFKSNSNNNDHQTLEFDEIILSTGYQTDLTYLDQEILNEINYNQDDNYVSCLLHKNVFPSKLQNIAFVGIVNTPFFIIIELMSRWCCYAFAGIVKYPTQDTIENGIKDQLEIRNSNSMNRYQFPYKDLVLYCDDLAKEIGACPDMNEVIKSDPQLYEQLWSTVICNASYRLSGPFSDSNARENIDNCSNEFKNIMIPKEKE